MKLRTKDFVFVAIQFCLFIGFFFDIDVLLYPSMWFINYAGLILVVFGVVILIIALLQLNINLSPFPSPKSNTELIQNGLYRYIRHPIYTGILLIAMGYGLYAGSLFKILISIGLYVLFYFKTVYEEQRLTIVFPTYVNYKDNTGRFIPKIVRIFS